MFGSQKPMNPMRLFKYYRAEEYNFTALLNNQIFLSKPEYLNDPFDTSYLLILSYHKFCKRMGDEAIQKIVERFKQHGICSFTKSMCADNRHLWSLYAGNYTGYVVEFDLLEMERYFPLYNAIYTDTPLNLDDGNTRFYLSEKKEEFSVDECIMSFLGENGEIDFKQMDRLCLYLHLAKDKSIWEIESEVRLIKGEINNFFHIDKDLDNGYLVRLPRNAIKSIVIGKYMKNEDRCLLNSYVLSRKIAAYEASPVIKNGKWDVAIRKMQSVCPKNG